MEEKCIDERNRGTSAVTIHPSPSQVHAGHGAQQPSSLPIKYFVDRNSLVLLYPH